jgi:hypothetical protein
MRSGVAPRRTGTLRCSASFAADGEVEDADPNRRASFAAEGGGGGRRYLNRALLPAMARTKLPVGKSDGKGRAQTDRHDSCMPRAAHALPATSPSQLRPRVLSASSVVKGLVLVLALWLASATASAVQVDSKDGVPRTAQALSGPNETDGGAAGKQDGLSLLPQKADTYVSKSVPELQEMFDEADELCDGLQDCAMSPACMDELRRIARGAKPSESRPGRLFQCVRRKAPSKFFLALRSAASGLPSSDVRATMRSKASPVDGGCSGLGESCSQFCKCGLWKSPDAPDLPFQLHCHAWVHICKRESYCFWLGGKDGALDKERLALENRAIRLIKEVNEAQATALEVGQLALRVSSLRKRPSDPEKQKRWDARVLALSNSRSRGRRSLMRIATMRDEIRNLTEAALAIREKSKKTLCGQIVEAFNKLSDQIDRAFEDFGKWLDEVKCTLIPLAFSALGWLGDMALSAAVPTQAAHNLIMQANPLCSGSTTKAKVIQTAACEIKKLFNLNIPVLTTACDGGELPEKMFEILRKFLCGELVAAVAAIISGAVECAAGCPNSFCPATGARLLQDTDNGGDDQDDDGGVDDGLLRYNASMSVAEMADVMDRDAKGDAAKALAQWKQKQHKPHE